MMRRTVVPLALLAACAALWSCHFERKRKIVDVLTTPGVAATGLPQRLTAEFQKQTGVAVTLHIVPPEAIVAAAKAHSGAAAILRDPDLDANLVKSGETGLHSLFAYDDFYLIGPHHDWAHLEEAKTAPDAFRRLTEHRRFFCSPVDVPLLQNLEHEIWAAARVDPHSNRRYKECHGTASDVIDEAARIPAYTLTERATYEQTPHRNVDILVRNVPMLHHNYTIALLQSPDEVAPRNRGWLIEWVMSYRGREFIRSINEPGVPHFYVPGER